MNIVGTLLLVCIVLLSISLQKTYAELPLSELKRRARKDDKLAKLLFKAASYGSSLRALLWLVIGLSSAGLFVVLANELVSWLALTACALLIWLGFVWIPASRVSKVSSKIAAWLAPPLAWFLNYLHPLFDKIANLVHKHRPVRIHTGLYDTTDLVKLIKQQQVQTDNRIDKAGLDIALHSLEFGKQLVREHLTPRRVVKAVAISDDVGPLLMSELHDSGHSRFPVYDGKPDRLVGTLYFRDLIDVKHGASVRDVMKKGISYIHEEQPLYDALQAIFKTHHHLFAVVNSFEEYVGIITMEDVLEQIIGKPILDEFDQYDDLRAVAARAAQKEHKAHQSPTPESSEVIE